MTKVKTVYDLIIEERERNSPVAKCNKCDVELEKTKMWTNGKIYFCGKCFKEEKCGGILIQHKILENDI